MPRQLSRYLDDSCPAAVSRATPPAGCRAGTSVTVPKLCPHVFDSVCSRSSCPAAGRGQPWAPCAAGVSVRVASREPRICSPTAAQSAGVEVAHAQTVTAAGTLWL